MFTYSARAFLTSHSSSYAGATAVKRRKLMASLGSCPEPRCAGPRRWHALVPAFPKLTGCRVPGARCPAELLGRFSRQDMRADGGMA